MIDDLEQFCRERERERERGRESGRGEGEITATKISVPAEEFFAGGKLAQEIRTDDFENCKNA